jgi:hypothetical protein
MKHKHHITPKHMGGSDDPSNLIELSVEEHAEAHRLLYERNGLIEDLIAWKCLSGRTITEEDRILLSISGFRKYMSVPENRLLWKNHIRLARKKQVITETHRRNIGKSMKRAYEEGRKSYVRPSEEYLKENYERNKHKMTESRRSSDKWREAVSSEISRNRRRANSPKSRPVIIDGVEYASIRQAAKESVYSYSQIRRMISS